MKFGDVIEALPGEMADSKHLVRLIETYLKIPDADRRPMSAYAVMLPLGGGTPLGLYRPDGAVVPLCDECEGAGSRICGQCNGEGTVTCDRCGADGQVECDLGHDHDCPDCDGERKSDCENCDDGAIPCDACAFTGLAS